MNNEESFNEQSDEKEESSRKEGTSFESKDAFRDLGDSFRKAFDAGTSDAKKAFDETFPKVKSDLAKGVHDVAYAVAYATAFGAALVREVTPENIRDGFREGTEAGTRAAEKVVRDAEERKHRNESEGSVGDDGSEPVMV